MKENTIIFMFYLCTTVFARIKQIIANIYLILIVIR